MNREHRAITPEGLIRKIDWSSMREQKDFIYSIVRKANSRQELILCTGILHLIDNIQDCAVDSLGIAEEIVFGKNFKNIENA